MTFIYRYVPYIYIYIRYVNFGPFGVGSFALVSKDKLSHVGGPLKQTPVERPHFEGSTQRTMLSSGGIQARQASPGRPPKRAGVAIDAQGGLKRHSAYPRNRGVGPRMDFGFPFPFNKAKKGQAWRAGSSACCLLFCRRLLTCESPTDQGHEDHSKLPGHPHDTIRE